MANTGWFKKKFSRALLLYRSRGSKWLLTSAFAEIPFFKNLLLKGLNKISSFTFKPLHPLVGIHSDQLWSERKIVLKEITMDYLKNPITVLEIGAWMGLGSTQLWKNLLPSSKLVIADAWSPLEGGDGINGLNLMSLFQRTAFNSTITVADDIASKNINVAIFRGKSLLTLSFLEEKSFDLIYIDASHIYPDIKFDIQSAKRLIKDKGMICGDDLDLKITEGLIAVAKKNIELDLYLLPNGEAIHPGVLLAVYEEFEEVNQRNGTWWVYKNGESYTTEFTDLKRK